MHENISSSKNQWIPKQRSDLYPETMAVVRKVIDSIPQLPISVQKVIEMTMDEDIGAKELAEVSLTDPVLSSKILTLVNSAYYGMNRRIDDMRVAIVLVGFNAVRNIAIQNRFSQLFENDDFAGLYNREELWIHSYLVSVCAESFADDHKTIHHKHGVYATLGMLHDIGKYALLAVFDLMNKNNLFAQKSDILKSEMSLLKKEELLFGINHSIMGAFLAEKWRLSDRIIKVIECHHNPSFFTMDSLIPEYREEIAALSIADFIVNRFMEINKHLKPPKDEYYSLLGFDSSGANILTEELAQKLTKAKEFILSIK